MNLLAYSSLVIVNISFVLLRKVSDDSTLISLSNESYDPNKIFYLYPQTKFEDWKNLDPSIKNTPVIAFYEENENYSSSVYETTSLDCKNKVLFFFSFFLCTGTIILKFWNSNYIQIISQIFMHKNNKVGLPLG